MRIWRDLPQPARTSLTDFAAFLHGREAKASPSVVTEPLPIPRPPKESVIAAIRRLRQTYPMLEHDHGLLNDASGQMTRHLAHGHPAAEVIDELERIFQNHYEKHAGTAS